MPELLQSRVDLPSISARHFVSFYQQPHYPVDTLCDYLADGLNDGEAVVAVVTPEHAASITKELSIRGLQINEMTADGRFACTDVAEPLAYLTDPKISRDEKHARITRWVEETLERAPAKRCRFLGELVSLMVAGEHIESAFQLEESRNQLLAAFPVMFYCIYEQTPFEQLQAVNTFCDVCNHHDEVLAAPLRSNGSKDPTAWFVRLQEQASAMREEVMRRRMAERLVFVNEANRLTQLEALLRVHGPNLTQMEKSDIVKVVGELQAQARKERCVKMPESPEWHKKEGEILGYEKVLVSLMRAGRKPNGKRNVS